MELVIKAEFAQKIADYLMGQPYGAVAGLVQGLTALKPVPVLEKVPDAPADKGEDIAGDKAAKK